MTHEHSSTRKWFAIGALFSVLGFVLLVVFTLMRLPVHDSVSEISSKRVDAPRNRVLEQVAESARYGFYKVLPGDIERPTAEKLGERALFSRESRSVQVAAAVPTDNDYAQTRSVTGRALFGGARDENLVTAGGERPAVPGGTTTRTVIVDNAPTVATTVGELTTRTQAATPAVPPAVKTSVVQVQQPVAQPTVAQTVVRQENAASSYFLQAGNFIEPTDAELRRAEVLVLGLDAFIISRADVGGATSHRVRVGPFRDKRALDQARQRLRQANVPYNIIRVSG